MLVNLVPAYHTQSVAKYFISNWQKIIRHSATVITCMSICLIPAIWFMIINQGLSSGYGILTCEGVIHRCF